MSMVRLRLLSFSPLGPQRRPAWANVGGVHLKASYRAMCLGVEMSHSCGCQLQFLKTLPKELTTPRMT